MKAGSPAIIIKKEHEAPRVLNVCDDSGATKYLNGLPMFAV